MKSMTLRRNRGFTLVEVMVVVVIMAILAAIVIPRIIGRPDQAKVVKAKTDISLIQNALDLYKLDNGFYPSTAQGLQALVTKPSGNPVPESWRGYIKTLPKDPWNHPYHYTNDGDDVHVFSYGANNQPGGTGIDAEISN